MNNNLNLKQKPELSKHFPSRSWRKNRNSQKIPESLIKDLTCHSIQKSFQCLSDESKKITAILSQYKGLSLQSNYNKQSNHRTTIKHNTLSVTNNYNHTPFSPKKQLVFSPKRNTQFWATSNIFILTKRKSSEQGRQKNSSIESQIKRKSQKQSIVLKVNGKSHTNQINQLESSKKSQNNQFPMLSKRGALKNSKNAFKYKYQTLNPQMNTFYSPKFKISKQISPKNGNKAFVDVCLNSSAQFIRNKSILQCRDFDTEIKGVEKQNQNLLFSPYNFSRQVNRIRFSPWNALREDEKDYIFDHQVS